MKSIMKKNEITLETLTVSPGGSKPYPIIIGRNLGGCVAENASKISGKSRILVATDRIVGDLYLAPTLKSLKSAGLDAHSVVIPSGERYKNFKSYQSIISKLAELDGLSDLVVVALGGGVVGDLAGFAAATYRRGIPVIQVPTTLLASVDSSVGGKTGLDLKEGKNLVGAFYQPRAVIIDLGCLSTLPPRELRAGMAEVLKYGYIMDAPFSNWLRGNMDKLLSLDTAATAAAVKKCCALKAKVVKADERDDKGVRAILNFGHTFAHAIEGACGYSRYRHGEAVAIGMVCAARLSCEMGLLEQKNVALIEKDIKSAGLPTEIRGATAKDLLSFMKKDKKSAAGKMKFVLLDKMGHAVVRSDADEKQVVKALGPLQV